MSEITRYRGDTRRIRLTVKIAGVAQDIAQWSAVMTINHEESPLDGTNEIEAIDGTIEDASGGVLEFAITSTATATVGRFFYDVQITDADGGISTVKDAFVVLQDIGDKP